MIYISLQLSIQQVKKFAIIPPRHAITVQKLVECFRKGFTSSSFECTYKILQTISLYPQISISAKICINRDSKKIRKINPKIKKVTVKAVIFFLPKESCTMDKTIVITDPENMIQKRQNSLRCFGSQYRLYFVLIDSKIMLVL